MFDLAQRVLMLIMVILWPMSKPSWQGNVCHAWQSQIPIALDFEQSKATRSDCCMAEDIKTPAGAPCEVQIISHAMHQLNAPLALALGGRVIGMGQPLWRRALCGGSLVPGLQRGRNLCRLLARASTRLRNARIGGGHRAAAAPRGQCCCPDLCGSARPPIYPCTLSQSFHPLPILYRSPTT